MIGLKYLKSRVVHRDLSPSNILIDKNGLPRIMDFGISVIVGPEGTQERSIAETHLYMSPEHFKERIPQWYKDIISDPAFILYPVAVNQRVVGLFYADRESKPPQCSNCCASGLKRDLNLINVCVPIYLINHIYSVITFPDC